WRLLGDDWLTWMHKSGWRVDRPAPRVWHAGQNCGRYKTGLTQLGEGEGETLVNVIPKPHRKEISMARKSRRSKRTIVGAAKSSAAPVQRIAVKAATAAASAAPLAAVAAGMKSMQGQTQTAAKRRSGRSRTRTSGTGQRKRR